MTSTTGWTPGPVVRRTGSLILSLAAFNGVVFAARASASVADGAARPASVAPAGAQTPDSAALAYARARDLLTGGRYAEAAGAFGELRTRHPSSAYVGDSYYWEAFALVREGEEEGYRRALALLDTQRARHPDARTRADADALRVRAQAGLARRGDADAAEDVARQAADPCAGEDRELRSAALGALLNMNAERALPVLREVLRDRGACSAELRRRAVFLVSQKMTDESVDLLLDLAHRDPDPDREVREQAVFWLSQVRSDEALDALGAILAESPDRSIQKKALFAVSQHRSDRSIAMLREYAERADAATDLRADAIFWIGQSGRAGGAAYLRELYARLSEPDLKERALFSVAQSRSPENRAWLIERARDRSDPVELRKKALFWAGQAGALPAGELAAIYRSFEDREMKEQIVFAASQRSEPAAVDFLMEVARDDPDPEIRKKAVFWLGQSRDPRVAEFLLSLIRR